METSLPKISIITPVRNCVNTLEKSIKSLLEQNYPNLEYIIIDAKSDDGTVEIIKKYQKYINYWCSEKDKGTADAFLKGIKKASGDIIAQLNADDYYEPNTLLKAGEEFKKNPDLDIVSFRYQIIKEGKIVELVSLKDINFDNKKLPKALGVNARFYKKDLFDKFGFPPIMDDQNRPFVSNDLEYMLRFIINGVKNRNIDHVAYNYVAHEGSLTFNTKETSQRRLMEDKIFIAKKFLSEEDRLKLIDSWKHWFKKSIKKNRALLIKSNLKSKNYRQASKDFGRGLKENNKISFLFYLIKTLIRK